MLLNKSRNIKNCFKLNSKEKKCIIVKRNKTKMFLTIVNAFTLQSKQTKTWRGFSLVWHWQMSTFNTNVNMSSQTSQAHWFSCLCRSFHSPSGVESPAVGRLQPGPFRTPLCAWPHQLPVRQFAWKALSWPVPQQLRSGPEQISQVLTAWLLCMT